MRDRIELSGHEVLPMVGCADGDDAAVSCGAFGRTRFGVGLAHDGCKGE